MRKRTLGSLFVLTTIVTATVTQADTRIGFASDRSHSGDVYRCRDDGSSVTEVTDESAAAHNPTIAPGGKWVVYDVNGVLYMNDFADPIGTPIQLAPEGGSPIGGYDANAGPYINSHRDFRILYTFGVSDSSGGHTEIYMAAIDGVSHYVLGVPALADTHGGSAYQPEAAGVLRVEPLRVVV